MVVASIGGLPVVVDDADAHILASRKWHVSRGYVRSHLSRRVGRGSVSLHRVLVDAPAGSSVDHVNGNTLDNRRSNLRICSHKENRRNSRRYSNNHSGFKGVRLTRYGTWESYITVDGKWTTLGTYKSRDDAAHAYDAAAVKHFGEFARLNFPVGA